MIQIIPIRISVDVKPGDDLAQIILSGAKAENTAILDGDIIVVAHKIVSKAEGKVVDLTGIKPSRRAANLAKAGDKDARLVELILRESRRVVRARWGIIITETAHGFVCANSGVDQSNVQGDSMAALLPADPDKTARKLKSAIRKHVGSEIAVVISDTFGRPFRTGQTNVAIGVAGIDPTRSYIGTTDMYGKKLRVSEIAVVDEIASAAELVMGKTRRIPAAIVRGFKFEGSRSSRIDTLLRKKERDLFR